MLSAHIFWHAAAWHFRVLDSHDIMLDEGVLELATPGDSVLELALLLQRRWPAVELDAVSVTVLPVSAPHVPALLTAHA